MSAATIDFPVTPPNSNRLWVAIAVSVAIHALLLLLNFTFPDASRAMRDKALDIILVNAKSARKPVNAQALAQNNLDGGGNTEEDRRARTPLPSTRQQESGTEIEQVQRRAKELEIKQRQELTQARSIRTANIDRNTQDQPQPTTVTGVDLAESSRAMARLEGEIYKSVEAYNKLPRRNFLSTRAEKYLFAQYVEDWRQKVERVGTLNYPEAARSKLYGSVILTVSIWSDGSLEKVEINQSSGHKVLDDAARRIVNMAAPYGAFSAEAKRSTDILHITRTIVFTNNDSLETK